MEVSGSTIEQSPWKGIDGSVNTTRKKYLFMYWKSPTKMHYFVLRNILLLLYRYSPKVFFKKDMKQTLIIFRLCMRKNSAYNLMHQKTNYSSNPPPIMECQPYFLNWLMNMLKRLELWSFAYLLILCFLIYLERLILTKKVLILTWLFKFTNILYLIYYLHNVYRIIDDFISKYGKWVIFRPAPFLY